MARIFAVVFSSERGKYPETTIHILSEPIDFKTLKRGGLSVKNAMKRFDIELKSIRDRTLRIYMEEHGTVPQEKKHFQQLADLVGLEVRHYSYDPGRNKGEIVLHVQHTSKPMPPK